MKFSFLESLTRKIGVDLGTSRVRIWTDQDGFVVDEPAYIAIDESIQKVIAVGKEALEMTGRVSENIIVYQPISQGKITDPDIVVAMLKFFLQKVFQTPLFFRPTFMVSVQSSLTEPEKEALTDVFFSLGAKEVFFIDQTIAAAIGSGVPIADASGSFFFHMGAGKIETGIISLGSLISIQTSPYAGQYVDKHIQQVVREKEMMNIGQRTAEDIKKMLVRVPVQGMQHPTTTLRISGQDVIEGVPKELVIQREIFDELLQFIGQKYVELAKKLFETIPAELTTDIIDKGMLLSGGLSQLKGVDSYLLLALGIPVSVIDEPESAVIKGIAQVLQNLDLFKESIAYRMQGQSK